MYSRFTNANSPFRTVTYGTQRGIEEGAYHIYTDRARYTPIETMYGKIPERNFSKLFESQFFDKIKTPEQAKVVQRTISEEGR